MEVKTYRAATMHEALALVRRDLGPDAAVLHTREVRASRLFGWLTGAREIEVTASSEVNVPSRLPSRPADELYFDEPDPVESSSYAQRGPAPPRMSHPAPAVGPTFSDDMQGQLQDLQEMVKELCQRSRQENPSDLPDSLFHVYTNLIDAEIDEESARQLVERVRNEASGPALLDTVLLKARIVRFLEADIRVTGPIALEPGVRRVVALIGPTGVGKTTTIAKLAAHYRLKEKRRVGLITVDTYRIAAVEQLRTYADIIDLPMHVVATPKEIGDALRRMDDLDLILMDTAGRSPKDAVKIRELRAFLNEAAAHEVHLVLSAVANVRLLQQAAERFAPAGTTSLILTKLDEATGLGNLLPVVRNCGLPLSYLTNGQNVPDDIEVADPQRLAQLMLATESAGEGRYA